MIVINLFGGPGSGKSTVAASVFARMKKDGFDVELVTEVAKDLTWDGNTLALQDPAYLFGMQHYKLFRLRGQVDFVVTDSPIILGAVYNAFDSAFCEYAHAMFSRYWNYNVLMPSPGTLRPYSRVGRNQTEAEARGIHQAVVEMLSDNGEQFSGFTTVDQIIEDVCKL